MTCIPRQLEDSVAARWLAGLTADRGWRRWETRRGFFRAAEDLLDRSGAESFSWQDLTAMRGSRSSFYAAMAHDPLAQAYGARSDPRAQSLAGWFGPDRVVQLIIEAKVWSYWPYRQAWVRDLDEQDPTAAPGRAVRTMRAALDTWADECGALGGALGRQLPVCAVEDLMIVLRRPLPVPDAMEILASRAPFGEGGNDGGTRRPPVACAGGAVRSGTPVAAVHHVRAAVAALERTCGPQRPADWERARALLAEALQTLSR